MKRLVATRQEAAVALDQSVWTIDRYIADGLLPVVRLPSTKRPGEYSRRVLIPVEGLEALVKRFQNTP